MFPFVAVSKMFLFSSGGDGFLIFANRHDIRHLAFDSSYYVELIPDQKGAVALDFDFNSGYIFWTDVIEEEIRRAKMEANPTVEVVANISVDTPDGIAVDWINKKLYWTDTGNDMIEVADFDGTNRLQLIKTGLQEPRAIVVHPFIGYVEEYSLINLKEILKFTFHRKSSIRSPVLLRGALGLEGWGGFKERWGLFNKAKRIIIGNKNYLSKR